MFEQPTVLNKKKLSIKPKPIFDAASIQESLNDRTDLSSQEVRSRSVLPPTRKVAEANSEVDFIKQSIGLPTVTENWNNLST